jgi:hypothetical protein
MGIAYCTHITIVELIRQASRCLKCLNYQMPPCASILLSCRRFVNVGFSSDLPAQRTQGSDPPATVTRYAKTPDQACSTQPSLPLCCWHRSRDAEEHCRAPEQRRWLPSGGWQRAGMQSELKRLGSSRHRAC